LVSAANAGTAAADIRAAATIVFSMGIPPCSDDGIIAVSPLN
jgi:hypothetical protein